MAWILGFSLWRCRRIIQRQADSDPPYFLPDIIRNSILFNLHWIPSKVSSIKHS